MIKFVVSIDERFISLVI